MSEDVSQGERSLVMIRTTGKGERSFGVTVRVGDKLEDLQLAYAIASQVAQSAAEDQSRAKRPAGRPLTDPETPED